MHQMAECRKCVPRPDLCNATMYYGEVIYGFLPIVQKVSLVSWVFWLFGLSLMDSQAMKRAG